MYPSHLNVWCIQINQVSSVESEHFYVLLSVAEEDEIKFP